MSFSTKLTAAILLLILPVICWSQAIGDKVCAEGFVMDIFCINRGTLLDNPSVQTLVGPDQHTVHCLVDVPSCVESGYAILKGPVGGKYSVAYVLDATGNTKVVEMGRAAGAQCSTCTGTGTLRQGLRAEVYGVIKSLGGLAPVITVTSLKVSNGLTQFCKANSAPVKAPIKKPAPVKAPVKPPVRRPAPRAPVRRVPVRAN